MTRLDGRRRLNRARHMPVQLYRHTRTTERCAPLITLHCSYPIELECVTMSHNVRSSPYDNRHLITVSQSNRRTSRRLFGNGRQKMVNNGTSSRRSHTGRQTQSHTRLGHHQITPNLRVSMPNYKLLCVLNNTLSA